MSKFDNVTEKARKVHNVFAKISSIILTTIAIVLLFMAFTGAFDEAASEHLGYGEPDNDITEVTMKDGTVIEITDPLESEEQYVEESKDTTEKPVKEESIFGYPEQEKELVNAGVNLTGILTKECFLYTYAEFKTLQDHSNIKSMQDVYDWVHNNTSASFEIDYYYIDAMMFSDDSLTDHMSDYLIPLVGDKWQDVIDKALDDYNGSDTSESTSITINYIAGLEDPSSNEVYIENYGNNTKEYIYSVASYTASNMNILQFNQYSREFIRDLDNNIGQPMMYSGKVISSSNNSVSIMYVPDYIDEGEASEIEVDISCISDVLLDGDDITVYGIYLGLNSYNDPVLLALSVTMN